MKTANLVTASARQSETGQTWEEKITNTTVTMELPKRTAFRVRATASSTTVTVGGILAMTMVANEVVLFNTGEGDPDDTKPTVTVAIAGAPVYMQVARETYRQTLSS